MVQLYMLAGMSHLLRLIRCTKLLSWKLRLFAMEIDKTRDHLHVMVTHDVEIPSQYSAWNT